MSHGGNLSQFPIGYATSLISLMSLEILGYPIVGKCMIFGIEGIFNGYFNFFSQVPLIPVHIQC